MSTIKASTFQDLNGVERYMARAWVNFNGVGTVAIRNHGNVTSITDNGLGDYTINFTSAMPDANYAVVGTTLTESGNAQPGGVAIYATDRSVGPVTQTTSAVRIRTGFGNATAGYDYASVHVAIFR